jgi:hypothetical protein
MPITSHIFHILPPEPPFPEAFAEVGRIPGRRTNVASNRPSAAVPSTIRCHSRGFHRGEPREIPQVRPNCVKQPENGLPSQAGRLAPPKPEPSDRQFANSKTTQEARRLASDAIPSTDSNFLGRTNCFDGWKRSSSSTPDPEGKPLAQATCSGSPLKLRRRANTLHPSACRPLLAKPTPRLADRTLQSPSN